MVTGLTGQAKCQSRPQQKQGIQDGYTDQAQTDDAHNNNHCATKTRDVGPKQFHPWGSHKHRCGCKNHRDTTPHHLHRVQRAVTRRSPVHFLVTKLPPFHGANKVQNTNDTTHMERNVRLPPDFGLLLCSMQHCARQSLPSIAFCHRHAADVRVFGCARLQLRQHLLFIFTHHLYGREKIQCDLLLACECKNVNVHLCGYI